MLLHGGEVDTSIICTCCHTKYAFVYVDVCTLVNVGYKCSREFTFFFLDWGLLGRCFVCGPARIGLA